MARPLGAETKDKPFREALRMELAAMGDDLKGLRRIAKAVIASASEGKMDAVKEIADRLDGKPVQATELTGKDGGPIETRELSTEERARGLAVFIKKLQVEK
jgi:acetylglutamate kinase